MVESVSGEPRGVTRWLSIHDDLLRGLTHALSNRIGTVSALAYLMEVSPDAVATTAASLRTEGEQLEALLQLLRVLPRHAQSVFEPVVPTDSVTSALALHDHHPDLRDLQLTVRLDGDLQPAYVDPAGLTMAVVIALGAAHRAAGTGGRATLTIVSSPDTVTITVVADQNVRDDTDSLDALDAEAVNWLLAPYHGHGTVIPRGLAVDVPTLQFARRTRSS